MANASSGRSNGREFSSFSFLWRFAATLALVLATYNPTSHSYFHWVREAVAGDGGGLVALHYFVGIVLVIGWTILLVATRSSLGTLGVVLGAAFMGTLVWVLIDLGWLRADTVTAMSWIVLVCLSLLLAIGLSWSYMWRRLTGQVDVTDDEQ
jgi:hypothetical protein